MKTLGWAVFVLAFLVAGSSAHAQARDPESPAAPPPTAAVAPESPAAPPPTAAVAHRENTLTTNPLGILYKSFDAEYERALGSGVSFFVGPSIAYASASSGTTSISMYGIGGTTGLRLFFGDQAPKGGWIGPQASIAFISGDFGNGDTLSATGYSLGGLAGYTWIFDGGFVLSLGGGVQYLSMQLKDSTGNMVGLQGVLPALRLSLGFGF